MKLELWTTFGSGGWQEHFHQTTLFTPDLGRENQVINLYPDAVFDTLEGFGGAVTDAAGFVYSLMDEQQKQNLMQTYFSPERMNYRLVRIPLDSCDFATGIYEAVSDPKDEGLCSFSFARTEKYILPMLMDAQKAAGKPLELMLTPWSPPAFMKTTGRRCYGGHLKPEYRKMWARYLCRYIVEFQKRGFYVRRISLQNEPNAVQTWDSCQYTAQEEKEFLKVMYETMQEQDLGGVEIFIWDHNKERIYERLNEIIDEETDQMTAGAAFHWYSGSHFESLELARRFFPDKKLIISESCIEFSKFDPEASVEAAGELAHELIGDLNHGMTAFYDWNLLLDERGGPNYVENYCLAPFLYDTKRRKLMPQLLQQYFEHFSHYLSPGSVRIGYSKYTDKLDVTAWKRLDGAVVVIMQNRTSQPLMAEIRLDGYLSELVLYPQSISSGVISMY